MYLWKNAFLTNNEFTKPTLLIFNSKYLGNNKSTDFCKMHWLYSVLDCPSQGADLYYYNNVAKCIYFHNSVGGINWKREAMYYCKGQLGSSAELVSIPQSNELWTQVTDYVKNWM